jgi:hypothetical protein
LIKTSPAQTLKTFNGPFKVGFGLEGEGKATYTYYDDPKTLERTKQGLFSYSMNLKNEIGGTFNKKATGSYSHGFKNGLWQYFLTYTDFARTENDLVLNATGNISLIAPYLNGLPNGVWIYKKRIIYRDKHYFLGQLVTTPYQPYEQTTISVTFKNGVFSGPFSINSNNFVVSGTFDSSGYLSGEWVVKTKDNEETSDYKNGFLIKRVNRAMPNGEILQKQIDDESILKIKDDFYNNIITPQQLIAIGYDIDRRNIFKEKSVDVTSTIFNDLDFMYTTLLGDKIIKVDNEGDFHIDKINYIGGDFFNLKPVQYRELKFDALISNAQSALDRVTQEASTSPLRAISDLSIARLNLKNSLDDKNYPKDMFLRSSDSVVINKKIDDVDRLTFQIANNFNIWKKGTTELDSFFKKVLADLNRSSTDISLANEIDYKPFNTGQQIDANTYGVVYYPNCCLDQYTYFQSEFQFGKIQVDFVNQKPNLLHFFISSGDNQNYSICDQYINNLKQLGYQLIFEGYQAIDGSGHISQTDYNALQNSDRRNYAPITVLRNNDLIYRFYDYKILFISRND